MLDRRAQREEPVELLGLAAVGRADVEMQSVLDPLALGGIAD
jgi:hypothetical protein